MNSEMPKPKRTHGGARPRAGRPTTQDHMVYIQITLTTALRDFAKRQPGGASAYIRRLIEADQNLTKIE